MSDIIALGEPEVEAMVEPLPYDVDYIIYKISKR
jgi:hypothetical protein